MKKLLPMCLCVLLLVTTGSAWAQLRIVTTTTDIADLARTVGGEHVSVTSLTKGTQDPHYIEPKPSFVRILNRADVFMDVGLGLEVGWVPPLIAQARNPKILPGKIGRVTLARGIAVRDVPSDVLDPSHGHVHAEGNPHYWLDPRNAVIMIDTITAALQLLDPDHAETYMRNAQEYRIVLEKQIQRWKLQAQSLRGKALVTHHAGLNYLVRFLGMEIVDHLEPKAGVPPSAAHVAHLIEHMQRDQVRVIAVERYHNAKPAQRVAAAVGARVLTLPTSVGGHEAAETYIALIDHLITQLVVAYE